MKRAWPLLVIVAGCGWLGASGASARQASAAEPWPPPGVQRAGRDGVTPPKVISEVKPSYTEQAMRARITGEVLLECVVKVDGTVGEVKVARSLDATYGLDASAVEAVRQWRFSPAAKNGIAVPAVVQISLSFSLNVGDPLPLLEGPRAFAEKASTAGWIERELETSSLRFKISFPSYWHAFTDRRPNALIFLHDGSGARTVNVMRPKPAAFSINRRLTKAELDQAVDKLKPLVGGRGTEVAGAGQIKVGDRMWFWVEAHLPALEAVRASLPPEAATHFPWETGRVWVFTTTAGAEGLQVSMTLLFPRGLSASDMDGQAKQAGAEFASILDRLSIAAQTRPNVSGTWVFDRTKSLQPGPDGRIVLAPMLGDEFEAHQDSKTLTLTIRTGAQTVNAVYALDGSESRNVSPGARGEPDITVLSRASWDGNRLVILTTSRSMEKGQEVTVETKRVIWLEDDSNLVIERSGTPPTLVKPSRSVYVKRR
jgi:TonB family protein